MSFVFYFSFLLHLRAYYYATQFYDITLLSTATDIEAGDVHEDDNDVVRDVAAFVACARICVCVVKGAPVYFNFNQAPKKQHTNFTTITAKTEPQFLT